MGFLNNLIGVAAPIAGSVLGSVFPGVGTALGGALGSAIGGLAASDQGGGGDAARQASAQQFKAIQDAQARIGQGAERSQGFLQPFQGVGQQGIDLAGFLGNPNQQFDFLQNNPLFQLGLNNLNQQTSKSAASRGRLTAGDTLMQLNNNAMLAGQPLIDRQRQDILSLLNIGQNTALQQAGVEGNAANNIADLLTSGGAVQAAGTIGAQNANQSDLGNIFDIGSQLAGNQGVQDFIGGLFGGGK